MTLIFLRLGKKKVPVRRETRKEERAAMKNKIGIPDAGSNVILRGVPFASTFVALGQGRSLSWAGTARQSCFAHEGAIVAKEILEKGKAQTHSTLVPGKRPACTLEEARSLLQGLKTSFLALPVEARSVVVQELSRVTRAGQDDHEVVAFRQPVLQDTVTPGCLLGVSPA
jgi:hypothetical protein